MATQEPQHLYKILSQPVTLPSPLPPTFALPTTPLDDKDGFVHLSTHTQVPFVLGKFFRDDASRAIVLIKISYDDLRNGGDVRWEPAGDSVFAHLYGGDVTGAVVRAVRDVSRDGETWDDALDALRREGWLEN